MRKIILAALCLPLMSCAPSEPKIVTQIVEVAVPVPCKPDLGGRPALLTKEQIKAALEVAPVHDDKVKIITEQLLLYLGWTPKVEAGLKGCEGPIIPATK